MHPDFDDGSESGDDSHNNYSNNSDDYEKDELEYEEVEDDVEITPPVLSPNIAHLNSQSVQVSTSADEESLSINSALEPSKQ